MVEEVLCIIEENNIPLKYLYNADQTGLYHQKLPSWIYIDKTSKKDLASVKRMKDKTHVTLMVCTAADGMEVSLSPISLRNLSVSNLLVMMHCQYNTKTKRLLGLIGP